MHPLYEKADKLSSEVIGAAIEVHRDKGPGLIESIYERCMLRELELRLIPATTQKWVRVEYKESGLCKLKYCAAYDHGRLISTAIVPQW
jgi:GxxExxY protein